MTEETASEDTSTEQTSLLDDTAPTLSDGEWFQSDGIKGLGDRPEWYLSDKYTSVNEQAKGYKELQQKFGSFTGTPKDGYQLPEGVEDGDELAKAYIEFATKSNMNQEGFNEGFELLSAQMGVSEEVTAESEMAKLGDNAQHRIKTVENILKNNFPDNYDDIKGLVTTAESIQIVEMMVKALSPAKLPIDGGESPTGITWEDIELEMFKKDEHGGLLRSSSPAHEAKIQRMQKEYGG